jgi:thioredoxin 1
MEIPATGVVLVDFFTTWCGPCRNMEPVLKGVTTQFGDRVKVMKVDCEQHPELSDRFAVRSVPTVVVLKDGSEQTRRVGMTQQTELNAAIAAVL